MLCYDVPTDGVYTLEIRDAIYRGREDFVYRINLGERPYITSIFPLGCRVGQKRYVAANGWNLHSERFFIDGSTHGNGIWQRPLGRGPGTSNVVTYEVDALRARVEEENNDTLAAAQKVRLPLIIGRPHRPARRRGYVLFCRPRRRRNRDPRRLPAACAHHSTAWCG